MLEHVVARAAHQSLLDLGQAARAHHDGEHLLLLGGLDQRVARVFGRHRQHTSVDLNVG